MKHILFTDNLLFSPNFFERSSSNLTSVSIGHPPTVFSHNNLIVQQFSFKHSVWGFIAVVMIVILILLLIASLCRTLRQQRVVSSYRRRSAEQLRFIRALLDLCYTYRESPAVFLDKFKDKVNIRELKSYGLIKRSNDHFCCLKEDERLLCQLIDAGFTYRELCVIFNLKKTSNLYTKYHRIQQKLNGDKLYTRTIVKKP